MTEKTARNTPFPYGKKGDTYPSLQAAGVSKPSPEDEPAELSGTSTRLGAPLLMGTPEPTVLPAEDWLEPGVSASVSSSPGLPRRGLSLSEGQDVVTLQLILQRGMSWDLRTSLSLPLVFKIEGLSEEEEASKGCAGRVPFSASLPLDVGWLVTYSLSI